MAIWTRRLSLNLKWSDHTQLPPKLHAYFLRVLAELLSEGFSLFQALQFLHLLLPQHHSCLDLIESQLASGVPIELCLQSIGFSTPIVAQLFYASRQARFNEALQECALRLEEQHRFKQNLFKQLSYPLVMGVFLIGILCGMRTFMLPQIASFITQETYDQQLLARVLIHFFTYLPQGLLVLTSLIGFGWGLSDWYLRRLSYLDRATLLVHLPLLKKWLRWHLTQRISYEFGYFLQSGFSWQQLIELIQHYPVDPFLAELANELAQGFAQGQTLTAQLAQWHFVTAEFPLIIQQGELTSQTATKCLVYAKKLHQDLLHDISKKIGYIQPLLFIVIGLLIMAMYLLMMLPMLTIQTL